MKARRFWLLPVIVAAITIVAGIPFVWSRDFGAFVIATFFYLPALVVICVALLASAIFVRDRTYRILAIISPLVIVASLAVLFFINEYQHDRIAFMLWYPFHHDAVEAFSRKDGIIAWDSWGMAGMENDAYLISDPSDAISDAASASRWTRDRHLGCSVAKVQRMRHGLYIFITADCPLR